MNASQAPLAVVVLAGGLGKRLGLGVPKVMAPLCGAPSLDYVLDAAAALNPVRTLVVVCHRREVIQEHLAPRQDVETVDQGEALGTGHAVQKAAAVLQGFDGDVLVLFGDGPLVRSQTLAGMLAQHRDRRPACTMFTGQLGDPSGYGRIVRHDDGSLKEVVEHKDADAETLRIQEVHCGLAVFSAKSLFPALSRLDCDNAQGEYYLTDTYHLMQEDGGRVELTVLEDFEEAMGFNTSADLLEIRRRMRHRILAAHQAAGVHIEDPDTVFIDRQVEIGAGTHVLPFTVIRGPVRIGRDCEVGPFTHLRAGAALEDGAEVGNFVEVKNSTLGPGVKAKHLTYLGDTDVGSKVNVGAGTITCNYDGALKHRTVIEDGAFIGSGVELVAPITVKSGAYIGSGSTPCQDAPADELTLARCRQTTIKGWRRPKK